MAPGCLGGLRASRRVRPGVVRRDLFEELGEVVVIAFQLSCDSVEHSLTRGTNDLALIVDCEG